MIGLDTNVLVRYIAQDDPKQSLRATQIVESLTADEPGFVGLVTLVELSWVLSSCYGFTREELVQTLDLLLRTRELVVEQADIVARAVAVLRRLRADFADCLIAASASTAGCSKTVTFDAGAAKAAGMTLIGAS